VRDACVQHRQRAALEWDACRGQSTIDISPLFSICLIMSRLYARWLVLSRFSADFVIVRGRRAVIKSYEARSRKSFSESLFHARRQQVGASRAVIRRTATCITSSTGDCKYGNVNDTLCLYTPRNTPRATKLLTSRRNATAATARINSGR